MLCHTTYNIFLSFLPFVFFTCFPLKKLSLIKMWHNPTLSVPTSKFPQNTSGGIMFGLPQALFGDGFLRSFFLQSPRKAYRSFQMSEGGELKPCCLSQCFYSWICAFPKNMKKSVEIKALANKTITKIFENDSENHKFKTCTWDVEISLIPSYKGCFDA